MGKQSYLSLILMILLENRFEINLTMDEMMMNNNV
jgi:hypothetical protein